MGAGVFACARGGARRRRTPGTALPGFLSRTKRRQASAISPAAGQAIGEADMPARDGYPSAGDGQRRWRCGGLHREEGGDLGGSEES